MMQDDPSAWQRGIAASATAFFLDVDGTLLGFKERPEDVVADADLIDLLRSLQRTAEGAVALVSGRRVDDLDRIVAPLVLPAGGVHGADLRFADGRRETLDAADLAGARDAARAFVADHRGLSLEDKGATLAVHFRAAPDLADEVVHFAEAAIAGRDLMVQHGKMVAEIKPRACHKDRAIEALMQSRPFVGRSPLFIGDDLTDEHGFEAVGRMGGWSIKVGPRDEPSVAQYRLADPEDVRAFLHIICRSADGTQQK